MCVDVVLHLVRRYREILEWHPYLDDYERLESFICAGGEFSGVGTPYNCWGYVDGTFRPFCRPTKNQRWHYSGHKKQHGFKYQAIATPDGLIPSLKGPFLATTNDYKMYNDSGVQDRIDKVSPLPCLSMPNNTN